MSSLPKIAIIGAGPSGLTLANILHRNAIPFTVYDLDASATSRNQGGTLDLHPQGGQLALRAAGLWDAFAKHARPESDVLKVVQNDGEVLWDGNGADARLVPEEEKFNNRPEIDRGLLKEILLQNLPQECLQWGKKLVEAVPSSNSKDKHDLHFADGTIEKDVDLLVGADGAWSPVRRLLTDVLPHYSGISILEVWALDVAQRNPWLSSYVGMGSCYSFGEGRTIQAQRLGDGSVRTYACLRKPESFLKDCGIDWTQRDVARKEYVERYFADCGEDLKRLVLESEDEMVPRTLYQLPIGFSWEGKTGVTLLGDAAHLMTPFAGVGVNVAMIDGLELAKGLVEYCQGLLNTHEVLNTKEPSTTKTNGTSTNGTSTNGMSTNGIASPAQGESIDGDQGAEVGRSLEDVVRVYEKELFPRGEKFAMKTMGNMKKHFSEGGSVELAGRLRRAYGPK